MRKIALIIAAAVTMVTAPVVEARDKLTGEAKLAKILEGRTAGNPVTCLPMVSVREIRVVDETALVFDTGRVLYVNRTTDPKPLDSDDILVTKMHTSQYCSIDQVTLRDRSQGSFDGFVILTDFVPYPRPAAK